MRKDRFILALNDQELLSGLKRVALNERKVQCLFLIYLAEIEKRKIYAKEGYSSLFRFLVEALHHSESSALKRIWVARVARKFPQIYFFLEDGKISLTALSKLCPYLNQANVDRLLTESVHKSVREVEHIICRHFPKAEVKDSVRRAVTPLSIDKVHIHFTADTEFLEDLEKAKALLSHKYPEGNLSNILGEALKLLNSKLGPKHEKAEDFHREKVIDHQQKESEIEMENKPRGNSVSRTIPRSVKNAVFARDGGGCVYVSASGKRCAEKKLIEYDHITPYALGGISHSSMNVRLLCRTHNRLMAEQAFGQNWILQKINDQAHWEQLNRERRIGRS